MRSASRSRLGLLLVLLLVFASELGLSTSLRGAAQAASPQLWLSQKVGPPTAGVQVHGYGFDHSENVLITFEKTQVGTATTDATGRFELWITVPKSALPGTHKVQATGQSSGLTAQTHFLVRTDWVQIGFGPHHTGYNPYENVLTSSNVSNLTLDWSFTTGQGITSSAAVVGGMVYIASDKLYVLDATTGALKWNYSTGGAISSSPAVANGMVYVGSDKLYALNAMTGALKWSYSSGNSFSSPTIMGSVVYVGSNDNKLYALDAVKGALKWSFTTGQVITTSPAIANGTVYIGSDKLYALDALTGALKWSYATGGAISSPAVADGIVYISWPFGEGGGYLSALDAMTGTLKWSYFTGYAISSSSPAVANGVVYLSADGGLYALDALSGALKWNYGTGIAFNAYSPAVANGVVYFGRGYQPGGGSPFNYLSALNAKTGALRWSYTPGGSGDSPPAVANGVVYIGSNDSKLYAFHLPGTS